MQFPFQCELSSVGLDRQLLHRRAVVGEDELVEEVLQADHVERQLRVPQVQDERALVVEHDFFPTKYNAQLVAGYSKNTKAKGLKTYMPDYDDLQRTSKSAASARRGP